MKTSKKIIKTIALAALISSQALAVRLRADEVTDWNQIMLQCFHNANLSALITIRTAPIIHASVFDAVNGIERRYTPVHVAPNAPPGASKRAAAVQAAYASLLKIFPAQQPVLDQQRDASLAALGSPSAAEESQSIARGLAWGQEVADAIWSWRSTDGFLPPLPPFLGGLDVGEWRPTPPGFLPGATPQLGQVTPWVLESSAQFRPSGPPALSSAEYASDFEEVKSMGSIDSLLRTDDETLACNYWQFTTASYSWNAIALALAQENHLTLSENARLFAVLDIAMADAGIACWEAKYYYEFWRPITAIALAGTDGNPATIEDPAWTPLLITPPFPEYPSGHSTVSGAAARVLIAYFGDETPVAVGSDVMPDVVRAFPNISTTLEEVVNARIFAGIHFRAACRDGNTLGFSVADYILGNALQPVHGNRTGQLSH